MTDMRDYKILAVDFDGTLCFSQWPGLGEANLPLIEKLKIEGSVKAQIKHLIRIFNLENLKLSDKEEQEQLNI